MFKESKEDEVITESARSDQKSLTQENEVINEIIYKKLSKIKDEDEH